MSLSGFIATVRYGARFLVTKQQPSQAEYDKWLQRWAERADRYMKVEAR